MTVRKWNHFPGPSSLTSLPVIGHAYMIMQNPIQQLDKMRDKYGDVFRCDIGFLPTVILCDHQQIAEIFKNQVTKQ